MSNPIAKRVVKEKEELRMTSESHQRCERKLCHNDKGSIRGLVSNVKF